jgi:thiol-disulfide isomerase/thioredoxin
MARRPEARERRRQRRLAAERDAARRATRRSDLKIVGATLLALGLVAAVTLAIVSSKGTTGPASAPQPRPTAREVASLPRQIQSNLAQANQVIDTPVQTELAALRGVPVVVNQWASWCPNCRAEFPFFQQLARKYRGRVAFLGLDSQDSRGGAQDFLKRYPVEYPSVFDSGATQAASLGGGQGWPTTIYFDRRGQRTYVRTGGYTTLASLDADIQQHALLGR